VIDLSVVENIGGLKYLPRQDATSGRIKDYNIYLNKTMFKGL
jgi:hypothetical protein